MDKTKSKLAAFFDNGDEEASLLSKPVDDTKLSQFTAGTLRKSRREKELEAAESKKKEEEANAAQVYAEFLDAFEGDDVNRRKAGSGFVKADSKTAYLPSMPAADRVKFRSLSPPPVVPKQKGKRAMDTFLEEIKREQAEREAKYSRHAHGRSATAMAAYEGQSGSKDRGDPQTTNLFVANLPSSVTELGLGKLFARVGPVGSVKIMWPRSDATFGPGADLTAARKAKGAGLNGFVSYMNRRDAEDALREFDGFDWQGSVLRVGWSKAVPIAAKPLYVATSGRRTSRSRSSSRGRERYRDRSRDRYSRLSRSDSRDRHHSRSPRRRSRSRRHDKRSSSSRRRSDSPQSYDEADAITDTFIRAVAAEVKGHDAKYEEALKGFEKNNSKFKFLLKRSHRRHAFYRGLIESEEPPKPAFDDDGYNSVYSTDSEEESEREQTRKNILGTQARERFEAMLRAMSGQRGEIAKCMTFCLEHAEAAHEVADIIISALLVESTPVPRKVARLHLICDILHNSAAAVPSAWKYRQEFQARLGIVFDHLANIYHSFPGRITADLFKKQITTVVDIWEDWIVFPLDFTFELRKRLEGPEIPSETPAETEPTVPTEKQFASKFKTSSFQLAAQTAAKGNELHGSDGEPMEVSTDEEKSLDGEPVEDVDIDGVPIDDIDGIPIIEQTDSRMEDDVDGEPIDLDGIPVDEDIDGIPVDT